MEPSVEDVPQSFELLPEAAKREVVDRVLRWAAEADYPPLDDEDLTSAAAEVFRMHDAEESRCG